MLTKNANKKILTQKIQHNYFIIILLFNYRMSKRINFNLTNDTSGNLGIGTTAPNYKLHIVGDIFASGEVTTTSDLRLKSDIQPIDLSDNKLSKIQNLKGVIFKKTTDVNNNMHMGFIAQELEEIIPEVVYTDSTGYKSIAYGNLTAFLFEYIKHLNNNVEKLTQNVDELNKKLNELNNKIN